MLSSIGFTDYSDFLKARSLLDIPLYLLVDGALSGIWVVLQVWRFWMNVDRGGLLELTFWNSMWAWRYPVQLKVFKPPKLTRFDSLDAQCDSLKGVHWSCISSMTAFWQHCHSKGWGNAILASWSIWISSCRHCQLTGGIHICSYLVLYALVPIWPSYDPLWSSLLN